MLLSEQSADPWCQTCGREVRVSWRAVAKFGRLQWIVVCPECADGEDIERWLLGLDWLIRESA